MAKRTIEMDIECTSCDSTGIYKGIAERDKTGVVCHNCKGTGCIHIKQKHVLFESRKRRNDVSWVVETNTGIVIALNQKFPKGSFGGMSYEKWLSGDPFKPGMENRKYTCPAWWYQSTDYNKKPDWEECISYGTFSSCSSFKTKEKCWEKFDNDVK